ncbi:hypothetical protein C1645_830099 [Glomus cerebriforme]|uniref:Uncharacterized protein n=1 Tax=Glomus cerebriforme TaxID=658196 RepID=A0A397SJU7_9GLOM|nr:hypothetical protein C1645_830099 [Glomus cerebriforme]
MTGETFIAELKRDQNKSKESKELVNTKKAKISKSSLPGVMPEEISSSEVLTNSNDDGSRTLPPKSLEETRVITTLQKPKLCAHSFQYLSKHISVSINEQSLIMNRNQDVIIPEIPDEIQQWLINALLIVPLFKAIQSVYREYKFDWVEVQLECIKDMKLLFLNFDLTLNKADGICIKVLNNKEIVFIKVSGGPEATVENSDIAEKIIGMNKSQITNLALNLLSTNSLIRFTGIRILEMKPCILCKQKFISHPDEPIKEFTMTICGCLYYQKYLEGFLLNVAKIRAKLSCPNWNCKGREIETLITQDLFKEIDKFTTLTAEDTTTIYNRKKQSLFRITEITKETSDQVTSPIEVVSITSGNSENMNDSILKDSSEQI